jgi:hypothetical protein
LPVPGFTCIFRRLWPLPDPDSSPSRYLAESEVMAPGAGRQSAPRELARPSRGPGQPKGPGRGYPGMRVTRCLWLGLAGLQSRAVFVGLATTAPANGAYLATSGPATMTVTVATAIGLTDKMLTISFGGGAAIPGVSSTQPISVTANSNDVNGNGVCPELPGRSGELPIIA